MRIEEIRDPSLRDWANAHIDQRLSDLKARKRSADDALAMWRSYNELDWDALRELEALRSRALAQFEPAQIDRAIQDVTQDHYTLGKEVKALRALLKAPAPERMSAAKVQELFLDERDLPDPFH